MVLSASIDQNSTKVTPKIPEIVEFMYKDYNVDSKRHATCTICDEKIDEVLTTTSNFTRHLRSKHSDRVEEYFEFKKSKKKNQSKC
jgi:uncharacterized protein YqgV (UPF0045/DUF77 family)